MNHNIELREQLLDVAMLNIERLIDGDIDDIHEETLELMRQYVRMAITDAYYEGVLEGIAKMSKAIREGKDETV